MSFLRPVIWPFAALLVLLAVSVTTADGIGGRVAPVVVLVLAAVKAALVVSEYVEVRGAARWLVAVWVAWGLAVLVGLGALIALS